MFSCVRRQEGGSAVELALILPLLVLILAGIADLGRAFQSYIVITNASREGARYASHYPDDLAGIKAAAIAEAVNTGLTISANMVTPDPSTLTATATGVPITVTVQYPFRTILSRIVGVNVITMTARTRMVVFGYD
ncbi:MAG: TadE/TadG family type IV pilus assembly protein [Anaerolineae bacterium]